MISIIIPVLNEAETIRQTLSHLMTQPSANLVKEIIIVDGGSEDSTIQEINTFQSSHSKDLPFIEVITAQKGRAKQMNAGAEKASGKILYFLHADSFPPKNFDEYISNEVQKGNQAGCFRMCFDSRHWWLRLAGWLTQFKWRACRGGDQSQFITKELFEDIGGFDERYIIYEDNILINELYKRNEFVVINNKLTTSCRLYERKGVWRLQYHFWTIYVKKIFGADHEELYRYYKKNIAS